MANELSTSDAIMNDKPEYERIKGTELREELFKTMNGWQVPTNAISELEKLITKRENEAYERGVEAMHKELKEPVVPAHGDGYTFYWQSHVTVEDIDAVAEKLKGKV